jgi:hypothetical protein
MHRNHDRGEQVFCRARSSRSFSGLSIHPRLPHDSPHPTATHPFRPRIHTRPVRRQAPTRGPLPQALDLVALSDSHVKASLTASMVVRSLWAALRSCCVTGCWASRCMPRGEVCWPVWWDWVVAVLMGFLWCVRELDYSPATVALQAVDSRLQEGI